MPETLSQKLNRVYRGGNVLRFLAGKALIKSGLCKLLTMDYHGIRLRFHAAHLPLYLWAHGSTYRQDDVDLIKSLLAPGDTFVDVGANVGSLTIVAARHVGLYGAVFSYEPHPKTFRFLSENILLNGAGNVRAMNCALGTESGEVSFSDRSADDQNSVTADGSILVPLRTLDSLVPDTPISLLKIDVEGYEKFVLSGASQVLDNTSNVMIEVSESHFERFGYSTRDIIEMLESHGFQCLRLSGTPSLIGADYRPKGTENLLASKAINELPVSLTSGIDLNDCWTPDGVLAPA